MRKPAFSILFATKNVQQMPIFTGTYTFFYAGSILSGAVNPSPTK